MLEIDDLLAKFSKARKAGAGRWTAHCPAHDDTTPSLSISRGDDGRWLLHCHAGCELEAVLLAVNLETRDLFPKTNGHQRAPVIAEYDYTDEQGALLFQVVRYLPKEFRQRRPDGRGGWTWNVNDVRRVLYRLPALQKQKTVFVVEGEKDADTLAGLGLTATTNAGGAGTWRDSYAQQLTAAGVQGVIVIPDHDEPGIRHARVVATSCHAAGITVKTLTLPVGDKGDVSDYLVDHSTDELLALGKAAPLFTPEVEAAAPAVARPVLTRLSDVCCEEVRWVWPRRIALGKTNIIAGEPGEGKSTLTLDLAARLTRGAAWPNGDLQPSPGNVLLLSAEDGLADTIAPRLDAAGADRSRVHALTAIRQVDGQSRHPDLARDLAALEDAMKQIRPALVVIDPLSAYLGRTDSWKDSEVRGLLGPLAALADTYRCALLAVMHFSKSAGQKPIHKLLGSIGFSAAARVILAVARDPDDEGRRLLLPIKNNLTPPADVLAFTIDDGRIMWESAPITGITAETVFAQSSPEDRADRLDAELFLADLLATDPMPCLTVLQRARAAGINERALRRAKGRLGVRSQRVGFGPEGEWMWQLPPSHGAASSTASPIDAIDDHSGNRTPMQPMTTTESPIDAIDDQSGNRASMASMAIYGEPATEPSDDDQPAIVVPDDPDDRECDISADSDRQRVEPDDHRTDASTDATMPLINGVTQPADSGSPVLPGTKVVHTDAREGTDDRLT